MENNKTIMFDGKKVFPMGVQKIIYGVKYEITKPKTNEKVTVGDGEVIYDVRAPKKGPYFPLLLRME